MSDPKVLQAQQWVNATYESVTGYEECPEDGRTGWSTMNALIEGLQHELGISPVVASFGPTTAARLKALGEIGPSLTGGVKPNIIAILQHALFCKGYWGADVYGTYNGTTLSAVQSLRSNMGIPPGNGTVDVRVARCILNMDAYVVVAGGTDKIRDVQRWLNGRYWQRDAYTIGPCDGIYSRDVQKSLMIAIQYELGLSPNGNFGPGTQAGLRTHPLSAGSSGIFVELFSAACVLNEPIGVYRTNRRSTYDATLTDFVRAFQQFSLLNPSGAADYQTWAQLLVSMGDPDRPASGCDTRFEITAARASWLYTNGYRMVGRYLYDPPGSTLDKEIKPGELQVIFNAGLRVLPIYQDNAREPADFTYLAGYQHAVNAHNLAAGHGFDRGTVIYFAVDYDATQDEIDEAVIPYFQGVSAGLTSCGKRYVHGVYGSRNVCADVTDRTFARCSFVSGMSWGFSGNLGFPLPANWSFNQIKEFQVTNGADTFDLDRDIWRASADPGSSSVNNPAGPADAFVAYVQRLYDLAVAYGGSRSSSQLVMEFIRHREYGSKDPINQLGWSFLIGDFDQGFIDFAEARGATIQSGFKDPYTGFDLGAEHLMATANGHYVTARPADPAEANGGDVAGWAGDLMTFYADWLTSEEEYASGEAFCAAKLAKPNVVSSFSFTDFCEDADGYLIAAAVRSGRTIVQAVRDHYVNGGGVHRFTDYFTSRWGTAVRSYDAAYAALTKPDLTLGLARKQLITLHGVALLPSMMADLPGGAAKLAGFVQGFTTALQDRVTWKGPS
ncbi:glycoside hydrolase domain-containing protein [Micromonospora sp. NPDC049230]|uniref:glycoside hydrolase domain-containing protein n=1 Tax=Micromonospora sp. NPDC049230 TaxID=3155502 RepID=UPI00340E2399